MKRLTAEYINECRLICTEIKVKIPVFKVKGNIYNLTVKLFLEKELLISDNNSLIASCSECRISLINASELDNML